MVVWQGSRIFKAASLGVSTLFLSALGLSGCAIATPATITSATPPSQDSNPQASTRQAIKGIDLIAGASETGLRARFQEELTRALTVRGVAGQSGADHIADFAVSERPAATGLLPVSEDAGAAGPPEPDFKSRWYHKCKPSRTSASLVVYARESGTITSKASGEFLACPGDRSQLGDLADLLVQQAIAPQ